MRDRVKHLAVLAGAAAVALLLFAIGLSYPTELRVRGDAYLYLVVADNFDSLATALSFLGERTAGMSLFDFLVRRVLGLFVAVDQPQPWVDVICATLFVIHFGTSWVFAGWMQRAGYLRSLNARHALFFFLATFPALVGYTTTPLTDTLAIDLILCGAVLLARALDGSRLSRVLLAGFASGLLFGFSILVRSGSMPGMAAGFGIALLLTLAMGRLRQAAIAASAAGCLLVLAPWFNTCLKEHGTLCLQYPAFESVLSAQAGLTGARTIWFKPMKHKDDIPTLIDGYMMANYGERCRLVRIGGIRDSSLTGCLLSRPLAIPGYLFKKWAGLMDHFRFNAYMETTTPIWLALWSRFYDGLAWIGFALAFPLAAITVRRYNKLDASQLATVQPAAVLLVVYAAVTLAVHTVLHVEDRYSFPWLPVCAVVLVGWIEKGIADFRAGGWRRVALPLGFSALALAAFLVQVIAWDRTPI